MRGSRFSWWSEPRAKNEVDRAVFAKLKALKINPTAVADDAVFLRRAYLDAVGVLPSPQDARDFLADRDPAKRDKMVEKLLSHRKP